MEGLEKILMTRLAADRNIDVMNHIQELAILGVVGLGLISGNSALKKVAIGVSILGIADHIRCAIVAKKHRNNIIECPFIDEDEKEFIAENSTMKAVILNYQPKDFIS